MKFKKIIGFGDSWMWGDELLDPALRDHPQAHAVLAENTLYRESHCFLGLVAQHYGVESWNFGWPGGSPQSAIWNYLWWLENTDVSPMECLVLVANTDCTRHSFFNQAHKVWPNDPPWNRYVHSAWIRSGNTAIGDEWVDLIKKHTVLAEGRQWSRFNFMQSALFFDGQSRKTNKLLLQFNVSMPPLVMPLASMLWPDQQLRTILLREHSWREVACAQNHPNELGHQIIAKHLIDEIERVII